MMPFPFHSGGAVHWFISVAPEIENYLVYRAICSTINLTGDKIASSVKLVPTYEIDKSCMMTLSHS